MGTAREVRIFRPAMVRVLVSLRTQLAAGVKGLEIAVSGKQVPFQARLWKCS